MNQKSHPIRGRFQLADSLLTGWAAMLFTGSFRLVKSDLEPDFFILVGIGFLLILGIGTVVAWRTAEIFGRNTFRQRLPLLFLFWFGPLMTVAIPGMVIGGVIAALMGHGRAAVLMYLSLYICVPGTTTMILVSMRAAVRQQEIIRRSRLDEIRQIPASHPES